MSIQRVLSVIAIAVAMLFLTTRSAYAGPEIITWPDMEMRLSDCDIVQAKVERNSVNLSQIEVVVELGPRVLSWKGVGVYAASGGYFEVNTPNTVRRDSMLMSASEVMGGSILLGKAKFLGLHTGLYWIQDLKHLQGGDRVTFTWVQDSCPAIAGRLEGWVVPDWVKPSTVTTLTLPIVAHTTWYPDMLLDIHFDASLGIPAVKIDRIVSAGETLLVPVAFKSSYLVNSTIPFKVWINQRGGDSGTILNKGVKVLNGPPAPQPQPPPPALVKVPKLINKTLEEARITLASLKLGIVVHGRDTSVPESDQTVYMQIKGEGSEVLQGVKIEVWVGMQTYTTPTGYPEVALFNCGYNRNTYHLWEYVAAADGWYPREDIPSMWADGNVCPGSNPPVRHTLTDGTLHYFVVVDPMRCKGNNPQDPACWAADFAVRGDSKGMIVPVVNL